MEVYNDTVQRWVCGRSECLIPWIHVWLLF